MLARPALPAFIEFESSTPPPPAPIGEEARILGKNAAISAQTSFALGRAAAHRALAKLSAPTEPLLRKPSGEVAWPVGFTGSISHTPGIACAVVGKTSQVRSLGIDLELETRLSSTEVAKRICTQSEFGWASKSPHNLLRLFCAKEALYKCLYPCVQVFFGFQDAELAQASADGTTLSLRLTKDLSPQHKAGFCQDIVLSFDQGYIIAAAWLPIDKS
ncbi:MAG: 4'-phosphopantetheinyl transferase superfamily protein [Oligoflexia bacterium]|nr:4'-phosphopantetheinyl transferase superfamily protein [Oligoflexia bacterium]